ICNPKSYLGNILTWFVIQLKGYSNSNQNITYNYDADGYRTSKTVNGKTTTYQYVNGMLVYECRPDMEIFYLYDSYSKLTGIRIYNSGSTSPTNYYVTTNVQGDVLGIYNANGVLLAAYEYDAWGNVLSVTDVNGNAITSETHIANINPFRYRSYYYDSETGLYYLNSRYYDPVIGRFISPDTTDILSVQADLYDKNLYAYCDNNPTGRVDVSGYAWETVFDIASLCISMAEVAVNPADAWAWVGLAFDTLDLIPFVTGLGETAKALRLSQKGLEAAGDAKKIDFVVDSTGVAIPKDPIIFNNNLSKMNLKNGKFYGEDSFGPLRIRIEQHLPTPNFKGPLNPYHCEPHFHVERRYNIKTGPWYDVYTDFMNR
ncbi:MAG: RHS repeat-associated core domain-containing protein, partial [Clostridia bacterium]|nr:RHS repeat-associated core domain-containing protein [Clostridia bacterium]